MCDSWDGTSRSKTTGTWRNLNQFPDRAPPTRLWLLYIAIHCIFCLGVFVCSLWDSLVLWLDVWCRSNSFQGGYILHSCCTLQSILLCKIKQIVEFLTLSWSGTIMAVVDSACLSILEATTYMVRMENLDEGRPTRESKGPKYSWMQAILLSIGETLRYLESCSLSISFFVRCPQ
jgi:hypothetical protein